MNSSRKRPKLRDRQLALPHEIDESRGKRSYPDFRVSFEAHMSSSVMELMQRCGPSAKPRPNDGSFVFGRKRHVARSVIHDPVHV